MPIDSAYLLDCLTLLLRWLHVIVGIAWIGASFYFVWLDNSLRKPTDPELLAKGVGGELWAVHGGGFYNPQKYLLAPKQLPSELHWFKWESYSTWITGFLLISTLYYSQASSYMVDPAKAALSPPLAVAIGLGSLVLGWLVYDGLCRLFIERSQLAFAAVYTIFVATMAYVLNHCLSGRAAFLHIGAMLATSMSGNVLFWIIPGQRKMVAAMARGEMPDPIHGKRGKQRSVHNNYLTLPVLFCMISNHYAFTYSHPQAWLALLLIMLAAVLIRHFFNLRHKGELAWRYPVAGLAILLGVFIWLAPSTRPQAASPAAVPTLAQVRPILAARCLACHAAKPTLMPSAPAGLVLDSDAQVLANAARIHTQVVQLHAMPLGNVTQMTEAERALLHQWFAAGAQP